MKKENNPLIREEKGYIALISALIISILLISMGLILGLTNYFNRFNILDNEYKEVSAGLADACANLAILKLAESANYQGNEIKSINGKNCQIFAVQLLENNRYLIRTQAIFMRSYTNIEAKIIRSSGNITVDYWKEIP